MRGARARGRVATASERFVHHQREATRARRRRRGALVATGLLLALAAWAVWFSPWFVARDVTVEGVTGSEAAAVRAAVAGRLGTPLVLVDLDAAAADVARARRPLAEARVERSWPGTLLVRVVPRRPALVLRNPKGQLEVVDAGGLSYATVATRPAGVPLVTATGSAGMTPDALRAALGVVRVLPAGLARTVTSVTVSSADLVSFTTGTTTVRWGGAGEEERKLELVQALLRRHPREIDVSAPDTPVTR